MDIIVVPFLLLLKTLIGLAMIVVVADVVFSWFVSLNILNINNQFVYSIIEAFSKISNLMLNPIRSRLPSNLGTLDISPVILLILLTFFEHVVTRILLRFA